VKKKKKRVGRGPGSGHGKTCGRGHKGSGSRSGYGGRQSYEGGQARLFTKLPHKGFSRKRFLKSCYSINLSEIDKLFEDNEVVNFETLRKKRSLPHKISGGIKILGNGELNKKVKIEAHFFSKSARKKLEEKNIEFKILELK
jgi:large subunit ribosomal protein L15